ncbi:MAG: folate-binding protein [Rubrivivax sp.]|nr:MAG: folate-binding protein [Rubrivivax sp.]
MIEDLHHATPPVPSSALGAVRLADWGVIRAQGEEAAKFLHTQLTQDLALQTGAQARLAGYCSAKGRLLATMLAVKPDEQSVLLALPAEVLPATVKRLSMFVLRAKCKLSDDSAAWAVWGLSGAQARDWLAEAGAATGTATQAAAGAEATPATVWSVSRVALADGREALATRLPDDGLTPRFLLLQPADAPAPALPAIDPEEWQGLDVTAGLAWVRQGTVEQFVPQMLNLELLGGVNFQKGCYPGQEIVARSQYRGTIKRRTHLFALDGSDADATPGQEIFHSADPEQPAGMVAGFGRQEGRPLLLAEVKLAALESGTLHLGSATGAVLTPRPLPYVIGEPE